MKERKQQKDPTAFDPPIRQTDEGRYIHISIELPKIAEEQIRIDLEPATVIVSLYDTGDNDNGNTCKKSIRVPRGVRVFKKKFSNGVLEIILEKTAP
nr:Hsp20/alpha crystallin family protein [uncultured Methanoregula sp.]